LRDREIMLNELRKENLNAEFLVVINKKHY
jgi:hypothetical protein